jgi:hypothetical protein
LGSGPCFAAQLAGIDLTAGPSTALRYGRDDNSVAGGQIFVAEAVAAITVAVTTELSSRELVTLFVFEKKPLLKTKNLGASKSAKNQ